MAQIHKQRLPFEQNPCTIKAFDLLTIQMQNEIPTIWYIEGDKEFIIHRIGTGWELDSMECDERDVGFQYITTLQEKGYVWFYFVEVPK